MSDSTADVEKKRELAQAEILISWLLRAGVVICGAVIAAGLLSRIFHIGQISPHSSREIIGQLLSGEALSPTPAASMSELMKGMWEWQADSIMTGGLLLLIGLPILRVALTVLVFLRDRDWPFLVITLIVLSVLLSGIFLGSAL